MSDGVIVPQALRKDTWDQLMTFAWVSRAVNLENEIKCFGLECPNRSKKWYLTAQPNPRETMLLYEIPQYPWQIVATDLFLGNDVYYVAVVDYFGCYWEIASLRGTTSPVVTEKLKQIFLRYGIPEMVKADNGPQYSSVEFATFANSWKFPHVTSAIPKFPQSNRLAEKTMQTTKNMLGYKVKCGRKDPYLSFSEHRNTPIAYYKSPAQSAIIKKMAACRSKNIFSQI